MTKRAMGWSDIRAEVEARVRNGAWRPGEAIPTETALAREFGCARATVNRALQALAEEGVLERRRRAGTRVASLPGGAARIRIPLIREEIEATGAVYGYRLISRDPDTRDAAAAGEMGLPPDTRLDHSIALHLADGAPHAFEHRWINPAAVPGLAEADFGARSANAFLLRTVPLSGGHLDVLAEPADPSAAGHFGVAEGTALLALRRTTWSDGVPVTHVRLAFRPGHRMRTAL